MPVSSPSYFPPAGSQGQIVGTTAGSGATGVRTFLAGANTAKFTQPVNDLIAIGDNAFTAGTQAAPITDPNFSGAIIVGSQALQAATAANSSAGLGATRYASIVVGFNAAQAVANLTSSLIIGTNALKTYTGTTASNQATSGTVIVGPGAMELIQFSPGASVQNQRNVVIGAQAAQGNASPNNLGGVSLSVIIGCQAAQNYGNAGGGGGNISTSVIIGETACFNIAQTSNVAGLVVIGESAGSGMTGAAQNNTLVGFNIGAAPPALSNSTCIGANAQVTANSTVVLGASAVSGSMLAAQTGGVFIGTGAGVANPVAGSDQFLLETNIGALKALLVGNFGNGTLVLGKSTQGVNRDQQGTNTLKIINGAIGGANPIGGGYLYVTGGILHWVDSAGVDTQVSLSAAGQLASNAIGVAYTNNAGAAAGTLTNAPIAGNPTKWIPIQDGGTIRNIPAW